jgi:MFS family permease
VAQPAKAKPTASPTPALIRRNIVLLALVQAIGGTGQQFVPALGAVQVEQMLGSAAFAGVATSLSGLARMLIAYPAGRLSDQYGRKAGMYLGLGLSLIGVVITGLASLRMSFPGFALGILVFGCGSGALQQLRVAAADMYPASRRSEAISMVLTGSVIGAFVAPLMVNLAERSAPGLNISGEALAWFLVILLIVPCIFFVLGVRPDPRDIALNLEKYFPHVGPARKTERTQSSQSGARAARYAGLWAGIITQGQMVMLMAMTSLALKHHGHSFTQISTSVAFHVAGMFGFTWLFGRWADRLGRRPVMLLGLIIAGLGSVLIGVGESYWIITGGTFLVGLGWSAAYTSATTIITDISPVTERGKNVGILDLWSNLAGMILPLVGSLLVGWGGFVPLSIFGVLLLVYPGWLILKTREGAPGVFG